MKKLVLLLLPIMIVLFGLISCEKTEMADPEARLNLYEKVNALEEIYFYSVIAHGLKTDSYYVVSGTVCARADSLNAPIGYTYSFSDTIRSGKYDSNYSVLSKEVPVSNGLKIIELSNATVRLVEYTKDCHCGDK
jgi:hypothetical protein